MSHELLDDAATVEAKLKPLVERIGGMDREIDALESSLAGISRWSAMQRGDREGMIARLKRQRDELRGEIAPLQERLEQFRARS